MASTSGPSKIDIEAVFHRLRAQSTNKVQIEMHWIGDRFAYTILHTPLHIHSTPHSIEQFQNSISFSEVNTTPKWDFNFFSIILFCCCGCFFLRCRHVLIAMQRIRRGRRWRTVYLFALIAQQFIEIWAYIWHLCDQQIWTRIGHGFNWGKCNWVEMQMRHNSFDNTIALQLMHSKSTIHVPQPFIAINWAHWRSRQWNSMALL